MTVDTQPILDAILSHGIDILGRRIFLHGDVDEDSVALAIRGMYILSTVDEKRPVELFVTSYGGTLDDAFALHDVTRTIRCRVTTIALGKCMSAAPLLVACGDKGNRWATPNTTFMLHDAILSDVGGSPEMVEQEGRLTRMMMDRYAGLLAKYTKKDKRFWRRLFDKKLDRYFTAEESLEWGLIDSIWDEK